jgi:REP element-mobilizing transposase RayT
MQDTVLFPPGAKWYHLVWPTYRRRPLFKIPATARFCERVLRTTCAAPGWHVDQVVVRSSAVHLLVRAPGRLTRERVVQVLRERADTALVTAGVLQPHPRRLWDDRDWCVSLTHARAVDAVRCHLRGAPRPVTSVREEPAGGFDDVVRLR